MENETQAVELRDPVTAIRTNPTPEQGNVPLLYLLSCSDEGLQGFELSRLGQASNLEKEVRAKQLEVQRDRDAANVARWLIENRTELLRAVASQLRNERRMQLDAGQVVVDGKLVASETRKRGRNTKAGVVTENCREDFTFRPFFDEKAASTEIRRLQTLPEHLAWKKVFQKHGCIHCHKKNLTYGSCGCCRDCYQKLRLWKKAEARPSNNQEIDLKSFLSGCDKARLARAALTGTVEISAITESNGAIQASEIIGESSTEPNRRKHRHWQVTVYYHDGEKFGRVYIDRDRAERFANRQKKSPIVKATRILEVGFDREVGYGGAAEEGIAGAFGRPCDDSDRATPCSGAVGLNAKRAENAEPK